VNKHRHRLRAATSLIGSSSLRFRPIHFSTTPLNLTSIPLIIHYPSRRHRQSATLPCL